ncbi:MAG TPA: SEC-C metal-binding domain-containing protein, partial [Aquabacterium sp.]|nr:SEC-C metal-binding domain-containing protein [Aquabacterium sp.]
VSNDQRKVIYQQRNEILESTQVSEAIGNLRKGAMDDVVRTYVPAQSIEEQWDLPGLERVLKDEWQIEVDLVNWLAASNAVDDEAVLDRVQEAADKAYGAKAERVGNEQFAPFERMVLLQSIDTHWREHLSALDYLRQGIHLRGYAQKNPKQEYKREAFELFGQMLGTVKMDVTRMLMTVHIQTQEEAAQAAQAIERQGESFANVTYTHPTEDGGVAVDTDPATVAAEVPRVGRNDPCPCGSGLKYKACHGKLA